MSFSSDVKVKAFVSCGRCCCICHKFCGIKMEVHHIVKPDEGGEDTYENAIPLCFDCHADMKSYDFNHPKGNKYTRDELIDHRNKWYEKVNNNPGIKQEEEYNEEDYLLYDTILNILPWSGSISFVRTFNFAGFQYNGSKLADFDHFLHECENPAFEFLDSDLEMLRASLENVIHKFMAHLSANVTYGNQLGYYSIPAQWEEIYPDKFKTIVNEIHSNVKGVCDSYDSFVRTCRRKLTQEKG